MSAEVDNPFSEKFWCLPLPLLDTGELIEKMGTEWKIPKPFGKYVYDTNLFKGNEENPFQRRCNKIATD